MNRDSSDPDLAPSCRIFSFSEGCDRSEMTARSVRVRLGGVEFCSPTPMETWTEMDIALCCAVSGPDIQCRAVVVSCDDDGAGAFQVCLAFVNMDRAASEALTQWSRARPEN